LWQVEQLVQNLGFAGLYCMPDSGHTVLSGRTAF